VPWDATKSAIQMHRFGGLDVTRPPQLAKAAPWQTLMFGRDRLGWIVGSSAGCSLNMRVIDLAKDQAPTPLVAQNAQEQTGLPPNRRRLPFELSKHP
jgi:hypothetical protein